MISRCETKQVKENVQLLSLRGRIDTKERNCNQSTFLWYENVNRSIDLTRARGSEYINVEYGGF